MVVVRVVEDNLLLSEKVKVDKRQHSDRGTDGQYGGQMV